MTIRRLLIRLCTLLVVMMSVRAANAQYAFAIHWLKGPNNTAQAPYLVLFDLEACNMCVITQLSTDGNFVPVDILTLPNGNLLVMYTRPVPSDIYWAEYDLPNTTPVSVTTPINLGQFAFSALQWNGQIYVSARTQIYTYDLTSNQATLVGTIPPVAGAPTDGTALKLFAYNGQVYGAASTPGSVGYILSINLSNPAASTVVPGPLSQSVTLRLDPFVIDGEAYLSNGNCNIGSGGHRRLDMSTYTLGPLECTCNYPHVPFIGPPFTGERSPEGFEQTTDVQDFIPCVCANQPAELGPLPNFCDGAYNLSIPLVTPPLAGNGDVIRYLLVTDPNNINGSTIFSSPTPNMNIPPSLIQLGVTYYVVSVVGALQNNQFDFTDPCTRVSNIRPVQWNTRPTVMITADHNTLCSDNCTNLTATFTGTAPFNFTYQVRNGNTVLSTQTLVTNTNTLNFQVCVPPGVNGGQIQVVSTQVSDLYCLCQ